MSSERTPLPGGTGQVPPRPIESQAPIFIKTDWQLTPLEPPVPNALPTPWDKRSDTPLWLPHYKITHEEPPKGSSVDGWEMYRRGFKLWMRTDLMSHPGEEESNVAGRYLACTQAVAEAGDDADADSLLRLAGLRSTVLALGDSHQPDAWVYRSAWHSSWKRDPAQPDKPSAARRASQSLRSLLLQNVQGLSRQNVVPVPLLDLAVEVCDPATNRRSVIPTHPLSRWHGKDGHDREVVQVALHHWASKSPSHLDNRDIQAVRFMAMCGVAQQLGFEQDPRRTGANLTNEYIREVLARRILGLEPHGRNQEPLDDLKGLVALAKHIVHFQRKERIKMHVYDAVGAVGGVATTSFRSARNGIVHGYHQVSHTGGQHERPRNFHAASH